MNRLIWIDAILNKLFSMLALLQLNFTIEQNVKIVGELPVQTLIRLLF